MTSQVAGGQGIFERRCIFFERLSTIKIKLVDEMMQGAHLLRF